MSYPSWNEYVNDILNKSSSTNPLLPKLATIDHVLELTDTRLVFQFYHSRIGAVQHEADLVTEEWAKMKIDMEYEKEINNEN